MRADSFWEDFRRLRAVNLLWLIPKLKKIIADILNDTEINDRPSQLLDSTVEGKPVRHNGKFKDFVGAIR